MDKKLRKEMENTVYEFFSKLDPTNFNTNYYKEMFSAMSDKEFDAFMKRLADDPDMYLIKNNIDYEVDTKIEYIEAAAEYLGCPLYEYMIDPHYSSDPDNPMITKNKIPIIYLHDKRMQQMANKKNGHSIDISKRDKFNQVIGKDKNGRSSDMENYGLVVLNADNILKEFLGPRADDSVAKTDMYSQILEQGYTSLEHITNRLSNKTTLNYVDTCLLGMGLKSDLVTNGDVLRMTLEDE